MRLFLAFLLLVLAPLTVTADDHLESKIVVISESSSGAKLFRVNNPDGLEFHIVISEFTDIFEFAPWKVYFVAASGDILWSRAGGFIPAGANWGDGPGVAYAGIGDAMVESPSITQWNGTSRVSGTVRVDATSGWMVFAWDHAIENGLSFELAWSAGTSIAFVADGRAASARMQDFGSGARIGVPAAARVNVGDRLSFPDEGYSITTIQWSRTDRAGYGDLSVRGDDVERVIPLTRLSQDEDLEKLATEGGSLCICYNVYRWVFSETSPLEFELNYVGDGRTTQIGILHVGFDIEPLPIQVSREWDLSPLILT